VLPIRLIAIDMDGTLLGEDGHVSPRNLAALHAARAAGVEIVVATGRRHAYAMRILRPLGLNHACALVSSNGTVTRTLGSPSEPTQLLARTHLPHAAALWLCAHIEEFRNALVLTFDRVGPDGEDTRGALVVEHLDNLHTSIGRWMEVNEPYIAHINPIESALTPAASASPESAAPIQAMLCGTTERMARAEARLLQHPGVAASGHPSGRSGGTLTNKPDAPLMTASPSWVGSTERGATTSGAPLMTASPSWVGTSQADIPLLTLHRTEYPHRNLSILDILPAHCSKGAAILALAATRHIDASQIMAIGDNWNDVSMLEAAAHPILMANAPDDLKALAHTRNWPIGPSNRDDGVAEAIESALTIPCP
jgi:hydroxymethylpyrimidine pyrophosphatase-like HAD family hydrolase